MGNPVKVKYSKNYHAKKARIRRLPKLVRDSADAIVRKDAVSVIEEYQNGIRRNNFGLTGLSDFTVQRKRELGQSSPRTPLYGAGDSNKNSLINALAIRKLKNGYRVYRRNAKHHTANLTLAELLSIHEHGALIKVTDKSRAFLHYIGLHLKPETRIIRIPPRPVVDLAIQRALRRKGRKENTQEVRNAIAELVNKGKENQFNKIKQYGMKEMMEFGI